MTGNEMNVPSFCEGMTPVALGWRNDIVNSNNIIAEWCHKHIEGEFAVNWTRTHIFFELPSDAVLFNLGFRHVCA